MIRDFRMKVEDCVAFSGKTILIGDVPEDIPYIHDLRCNVVVGGVTRGVVTIAGEVQGARGHRDLWTTSPFPVECRDVAAEDVWIIACEAPPTE